MKTTNILYWVFTILLSAGMLFSAVMSFKTSPESAAMAQHIGYPAYLFPFLAVLKILGIAVILIDRTPRLKEWAYAGFAFDVIGAAYSFIAVGDGASSWAGPVVFLIMVLLSYYFWRKRQSYKAQAA